MKKKPFRYPEFIVPKNCSVPKFFGSSDQTNLEISVFLLLKLLFGVEGSLKLLMKTNHV